jgi:hypothetical protein
MTIERNIDTLFSEELDAIAARKNYIQEAEKILEAEFYNTSSTALRSNRRAVVAAGVAAAAIAAFFAYVVFFPGELTAKIRGSQRLVVPGSWVSSANMEKLALDFSDGSEISLTKNTELRVHALRTEGAHVALERGNIKVSVVHESLTKWDFDVGPFRIRVTGTRFSVDWLPEEKVLLLNMAEGSVVVKGPMLEDGEILAKRDRLCVSLSEKVVEITKKDRVERIVSTNDQRSGMDFTDNPASHLDVPSKARTDGSERRTGRDATRAQRGQRYRLTTWRSLAKKGQYAEAIAMVNNAERLKITTSGSSRDLMLLGDAARFSNNTNLALDVYKTVRKRFPKSAESQRAAFTLGRIQLEQKRNAKQAARWFEICYRDNRHGTIAREAAGRLIEALERAGDLERARSAAREYYKRYPTGPHHKLAEKILSISGD